jgi:hypothetical protein
MMREGHLAEFFRGHSDRSRKRLSQHFIELICAKAGGTFHFTGTDALDAHRGLRISEEDWNAFIAIFQESCAKHSVADAEGKELLLLINTFKQDVVDKGEG